MKIILINNLYGEYARGGAERIVQLITDELVKFGHEIVVVSTNPAIKSIKSKVHKVESQILNTKYQILTFYSWNIISYYNLGKLPKFLRPLWHLINIFNIQSYFKIKSILKKEKPDIVMTHNLMGVGFLTPLAIKKCGIKHVHTLHDIQLLHPSGLMMVNEEKKVDSFFASVYQWCNKKLFASVNIVVSPSQWLLNEHIKRGFFKNAKKVVIGNPTINNGITSVAPLPRNDSHQFIFLYTGQIEKHKGVELLIEAFADLKHDQYELWIVGDDSSKILNTRYQIPNTKYLGKKNHSEIQNLMRQTQCLVVPSLCYENQPTVILEAQQVGLPVIASNIGGIPEMIDEKFLFKAGDRESLKNKMKWARDNYNNIKNNIKIEKLDFLFVQNYIDRLLAL